MPTKTEFLNAAMDLLDNGQCPTPQLGDTPWGRLIALGRELLSAEGVESAEGPTPLVWAETPPKAGGTYLFFGRLEPREVAPKTRLVYVMVSPKPDRYHYLCHGSEIHPFDPWGEVRLPGQWAPFTLPRPPGA